MDWLTVIDAYVDSGDARHLRDWLHGYEQVNLASLEPLPFWFSQDVVSGARKWITDAMGRIEPVTGGRAVLALYLAALCTEAWELSYHHERIEAILAALGDVRVAEADRVTAAVLRQLGSLRYEIAVERALTCAAPAAMVEPALRVVAVAHRADRDAEDLERRGEHLAPVVTYLRRLARTKRAHYRALVAAAGAVAAYTEEGPAELPRLRRAVAQLRAVDSNAARSHRRALECLAAAVDRPWLVVERGRIVYLYPFAVRGASDALIVRAVRNYGSHWKLAGQPVRWVRPFLPVDDTWEGSGAEQRYRGVLVELPDVFVTTADGHARGPYTMELRFSSLGNHYLRVSCDLAGAMAPDLYEALHRAAPEHGLETLSGAPEPTNLARRVREILEDLRQRLLTAFKTDPDLDRQLRREGRGALEIKARPNLYHVVLSVGAAALAAGPGRDAERTPVESVAGLRGAVGWQILGHPVPEATHTLAEWIRYPAPRQPNPLRGRTLDNEYVLATLNTTVLVMLGTPDPAVAPLELMAEFTASLEGLIGAWRERIVDYRRDLVASMDEVERSFEAQNVRQVAENLQRLQSQQLKLQRVVAEAQALLMHLFGPTLVGAEVERDVLDRLAEATGVLKLRGELHEQLDQASNGRAEAVIDALARLREQKAREATGRADRKQNTTIQAFAWVFGAASVSGAFQVLQGNLLSARAAGRWALGILVVGVVIGLGTLVRGRVKLWLQSRS